MHNIRVSGIMEESIVDGPGIRYVIFTQGCPHLCEGCHNPETHGFDGGYLLDTRTIISQFKENPLLSGMTFSGGEPFMQPEPLCDIAQQVKELGKNIVVYSGYTFEQLLKLAEQNRHIGRLLSLTDLLIDGPYIDEEKDLELQYRGSANQRVLSKEAMGQLSFAHGRQHSEKAS